MSDKTALFEWLDAAIDGIKPEQATIVLNINGSAIYADTITLDKEFDSQGRLVTVKRTTTTHLRIERRVLKLAK